MKKLFYLILVLTLLLVSCESVTENPASTFTSTLPLPPVITSISTSTQIPIAIPTTQTATRSVTPTPSQTPTVVPAELGPLLTAQVSWKVCTGVETPNYKADLSPDGNWLAVKCHDTTGFTGTKISRLDGTLSWQVSFFEPTEDFKK